MSDAARARIRAIVPARWKYAWRYLLGNVPWDTGITPPEVTEFIGRTAPGSALDLGCGTGTNAVALARSGWRVTGVDFAARAIREARRKAAEAGVEVDFLVADASDLREIAGPYDYALDIGCLHSLPEGRRTGYADGLSRLLRPGGRYMLYAWLPRERSGGPAGIAPEAVRSLLREAFAEERMTVGAEKDFASAWYWFRRRPDRACAGSRKG
jgi:SAM-dependent methyltransferase